MLTFEQWLVRYAPRDRAYYVADMREGWDGCLREFHIHEWEFRVVERPTLNADGRHSKWHVIPFVCIQPMLELFAESIELRPVYTGRGRVVDGVEMLNRLNKPEPIPF